MTRRILLAGSTGLVGGLVGTRLAGTPEVDLIRLVRNGASGYGHAINFERLCQEPAGHWSRSHPTASISLSPAWGRPIATAGSQAAMFRVDHDYVLAVAQGARALGARQFILVTAAGAGGPGFYLQTKGKIEQAVTALGFKRVDIIRPGFLLGTRGERRCGK
ncbi:hypothetical protein [Beijerinckia indica]|uniref:Male sterility domain protein n=1 Tax=Beijerinckia indica subsp. indica (strain ATCC 9039 / DSM 1715 / NCIMB 8712) TaxID=395963 RepID=B2IB02_BEII9|nr:hypothetical protein [Beijerinckia indica]ACB93702.1 male sterility domain protein [Beijerinckia indica subsp. indica ATCC 9039]